MQKLYFQIARIQLHVENWNFEKGLFSTWIVGILFLLAAFEIAESVCGGKAKLRYRGLHASIGSKEELLFRLY